VGNNGVGKRGNNSIAIGIMKGSGLGGPESFRGGKKGFLVCITTRIPLGRDTLAREAKTESEMI